MTVDQTLIALRRAAENDYPWSVSPHEAAALVAEVERLRVWAEQAAKAENANAEDLEAARDTIQRLTDLVRYQRGPLHDTGLISDEEYAVLAGDHAAVARLEGYDALRADLTRLLVDAKKEGSRSAPRSAERAAVVAWLRARGMADYAQSNLDFAATMIERGEHRREEDK
jgi:hypothetical protein